MNDKTLRIMLVDDHAVVRAGLRRLFDDADSIEVIVEAESGEQACTLYTEHKPDVVVMDLSMPGIGGMQAMRRILAKDENARILVLSVHDDSIFPMRVVQAGARGYLTKGSDPKELINAVKQVADNQMFFEADMMQQMEAQKSTGKKDPIDSLSAREFEIFCLLAEGRSVIEIAESLCLSPKTVGTHQTRILRKLELTNAAQLAHLAMRHGVLKT
jgi:two-component system invasion response regulator UvrY